MISEALLTLAIAAAGGRAQRAPAEAAGEPLSGPRTSAADCPYCRGDAELMRASGTLSHGGFAFGTGDTLSSERLLPDVPLLWIETRHFEIGMGLDSYALAADERDGVLEELEELQRALPSVPTRVREIDPWLRLHLYAQRADRLWARVCAILGVRDEDFPAAGSTWELGQPYRGEGPHLGMGGKFELLILPARASHEAWLLRQFGLRSQHTQRWNVADRQTLIAVIDADVPRLRLDAALHGHVVFTLTTNLLDGYEFYAYDTPVWLREGLAHALERELDPRYNSFSYSEASLAEDTRRTDWTGAVRRMIADGQAPGVAELARVQNTAQLGLRHHLAAWSITSYLLAAQPEGYACLTAALHGIRDARGEPDGGAMVDKQRDAFQECLGKRFDELDEAWRAWALRQEPPRRTGKRFRVERGRALSGTPAGPDARHGLSLNR